jgi:branched-chain amino acid transport system permease protein
VTLDRSLRFGPGALAVLLLAFAPLYMTDFYLSAVVTKALWLGIAAVSLIFLASFVGMVSLGQVALYGIAGFTMANLVAAEGGSDAAWNPWLAAAAGLVVVTLVGLFLGAIASRSYGIYFLMITLAVAVLVYYFFAQVTDLSGFGGVNNVERPGLIGNPFQEPAKLFYVALVLSAAIYAGLRYLGRTPLGLAFQGLRDDPSRMRALGYNVILLRTVAFALGAFVAGIAGILSVWWNSRISPGSISLAQTIDVLVIAVVGGLYRLEGAWVGAFGYAALDNWIRGVEMIGQRFNTVVGLIFLAVVLLSPGGLMGIWESASRALRRRVTDVRPGELDEPEPLPLTETAHPADAPPVP